MLEIAKKMPKTEVEKFFDGVKSDEQVDLEKVGALDGDKAVEKTDDPEKVPNHVKNRQHRRLEERLQAEREANIALNERLKAKEEAMQNVAKDVPIDNRFKRLFGDDEKGLEISKHFTEILKEVKGEARTEAIKDIKAELDRQKREEAEAVSKYESKIESGLEAIEDEYGIDFTSSTSSKSRKEFLDFVTKIAPKGNDGSPSDLPDLLGAYEIYKNLQPAKQTNTRRTEIAARSMQSSGQVNTKQEQMTDEEKWLLNNGIIKPRKR